MHLKSTVYMKTPHNFYVYKKAWEEFQFMYIGLFFRNVWFLSISYVWLHEK
jgi:hypothetical protein